MKVCVYLFNSHVALLVSYSAVLEDINLFTVRHFITGSDHVCCHSNQIINWQQVLHAPDLVCIMSSSCKRQQHRPVANGGLFSSHKVTVSKETQQLLKGKQNKNYHLSWYNCMILFQYYYSYDDWIQVDKFSKKNAKCKS